MDYIIINGELYHHGVKGMKWGQHIFGKVKGKIKERRNRTINKTRQREKEWLINDAKTVTAKAGKGTTLGVSGRSVYKKKYGRYTDPYHIVDDKGKVKLSYLFGEYGAVTIAAGKEYVDKHIQLDKHFRYVSKLNIEYDVYD